MSKLFNVCSCIVAKGTSAFTGTGLYSISLNILNGFQERPAELASSSQPSMWNLCSIRVKKNILKDYSPIWKLKKKNFPVCSYKRIIYSWFNNDCILRRLWAKRSLWAAKNIQYCILWFSVTLLIFLFFSFISFEMLHYNI